MKAKIKIDYLTSLILLLLMGIMLYIRTVPVYNLVFTDWPGIDSSYVNFAADDAIYHMRLVHNTLAHFPWRIFFDPYTHYPFGSQIHFGPVFTLIIVGAAFVLGLGHPSYHLVDVVGAYTPAVMGALCVIPCYLIGKYLFGRNAGLLAAIILAILPGEFLHRSMLGFTDNHVAEVLFSTSTLAFLIKTLTTAEKNKLLRKGAIWTGVFLGLYLLVWAGALLLAAIIFSYFLLQICINYYRNNVVTNIVSIAIPVYVISIIMVLPYAFTYPTIQLAPEITLSQIYYSLLQPYLLLGFLGGILGVNYISLALKRYRSAWWLFPIIILILFSIGFWIVAIINPKLINMVWASSNCFLHSNQYMQTIQELHSIVIDTQTGKLSYSGLWHEFYLLLPLTIWGMIVMIWRVIKYQNPAEILFILWSLIIAVAMLIHQRFSYYFAINCAVFSGYISYQILCYLYKKLYNKQSNFPNFSLLKYLIFIIGILLGIRIITWHWIGSGPFGWLQLNWKQSLNTAFIMPKFWYDNLVWLREHTPDPQQFNITLNSSYETGFYPVPKNPGAKYPYPVSAYGVLSWWDYGHDITVVARRIPNANPFQVGILENNNTAGVAPFLVSLDEDQAVQNLIAQGVRYIVIDNEMATVKFAAISIWANIDLLRWSNVYVNTIDADKIKNIPLQLLVDTEMFHHCMLSRLYYQDGDNMSHFRLVHEAAGDYIVTAKTYNTTNDKEDFFTLSHGPNLNTMAKIFLSSSDPAWLNPEQTVVIFDSRPPVKLIKIFEFVAGATITGTAPNGAKVTLTLKLVTPEGRYLTYTQEQIVVKNTYKFTVPYPTESMRGDGYSYDITPVGTYQLQIGFQKPRTISVTEKAVMHGAIINVLG